MERFTRTSVPRTLILLLLTTWGVGAIAQVQPAFNERIIDEGHGKILVADIDADGQNAIIQRGSGGEALTWYEYLDDGSLEKHVIIENVRFRGDRIDMADIDGDGDLDLVTGLGLGETDDAGFTVVWIENPKPDGNPADRDTWEIHTIGPQNGYMKDLFIVDFDGDGLLDVVTRAHEQTAIYFQHSPDRWTRDIVLGHESHEGMDVGDLDLDGDPDIILNGFWFETPDEPRTGTYTKHVIDPRWFTPVENSWRDNNASVAVADVTGNGLLDVITCHSELPGYPLSVYTASSVEAVRADDWQERRVADVFDFCQTLAVGDVDNDGDLDILAAKFERDHEGQQWRNEPPYPVVVFYNDGEGKNWTSQVLSEESLYAGVLGDVGSDGDLDVVGPRSYWTGPIRLWENQLSDKALPLDQWTYIQVDDARGMHTVPGGAGWWKAFGLALGDISNDGLGDIVSGEYYYINPGGDMTGKWTRGTFPIEVDATLLIDIDGDEYADVIGQALPALYWLEAANREATSWTVRQIGTLPSGGHGNTQLYAAAQLVPGGRPELLFGAEGGRMYYFEIPENPEDLPWPMVQISHDGSGYGYGDIDGDGFIDVAGSYPIEGGDPVPGTSDARWFNSMTAWWKNPGDGTAIWQRFDIGEATHTDRYELADINGDGRLDLVITEERYWGLEPNANLYWYEQPEDPKQPWTRHTVTTQYSMNNLDVADMDQDGDLDILTNEHRMPQGNMQMPEIERTQIWENDGKGNFTVHNIDKGKESHLGSQVYDMDGDGDLDMVSIAWRNAQNLHLWRNDAVQGRPARRKGVPEGLLSFGEASAASLPPFRLPIEVGAAGHTRENKVVSFDLNFTQQLETLGVDAAFDPASLRLVEVDAHGNVVDPEVVFQFDTLGDFDPATRATGTLVFMLEGTTPSQATRRYQLYFGDAGSGNYKAASFASQVQIEDIGMYESFPTWKITTPGGIYFYHKVSGGFASLLDADGNDWISYHPDGGAEGNYRGIPNIAPVDWHPGRPEGKKPTQIVHEGPLRLRLLTETEDEQWRAVWDIFPHYATMTLLQKGEEPYWILYEGTPGGTFDMTDYFVTSHGHVFDDMERWEGSHNPWHGDLPGPEWVYFGDANLDRVMYYVLHEDNEHVEEFWNFGQGGMTVWGFGRGPRAEDGSGWQRLTQVPVHLTVGFAEDNTFAGASRTINSAYRPVIFSVGSPERLE